MRFFIIFAVGAAILSLELTASKILRPYFGDNLYIWAAILSTTLLCMALGYALGGRLSRRFSYGAQAFFFNHAPALSGLAIMISASFYPLLFKSMALSSLVVGCFAAALILIGPALIMLAGMPPLLVALHRQPPPITLEEAKRREKARKKRRKKLAAENPDGDPDAMQMTEHTRDDAGTGWIYTLETLGAITGVLFTAFVLMPYVSSYNGYMLIGAFLAGVSLLGTVTDMHLNPSAQMHTRRISVVVVFVGLCLFGISFVNGGNPVAITPQSKFAIRATVNSPFGGLKVVDMADVDDSGWRRLMLNQGISQAEMNLLSRPTRLYQYYLPGMAAQMTGRGDRVLVLGVGGGIIPMELEYIGRDADAVEIDPRVTMLAEEEFVLDPERVKVYEADARTFMRDCEGEYNAVLIDLFRGDGVPEHLVTREFFQDIRHCLKDNGGLVLNIMYNDLNAPAVMALLATMRDVFGRVAFAYPDSDTTGVNDEAADQSVHKIENAYIFTSLSDVVELEGMEPDITRISPDFYEGVRSITRNIRVYGPDAPELANIAPMTDENNPWRELSADFSAYFRQETLRRLHRALLVD